MDSQNLMSEVKLSNDESSRTASNYLRGTIADGLADEYTGSVSREDEQLLKFHGTYQLDDRDVRIKRKRARLKYSNERQDGESLVIRVGIIREITHGSEVHKEHESV